MKPDSKRKEPRLTRDLGDRRASSRRRYLYEIEFFDAGHVAAVPAAGNTREGPRASEALLEDPERGDGPRDPRLEQLIRDAADGWVTSKVELAG